MAAIGRVLDIDGDDVWIDGEFGTTLHNLANLGKTWTRAPQKRRKART